MGCGASTVTVVHPLVSDELEGDEDETGSKHGGRGDSAVSKATTDSGVVMENRETPMLPGAVPRKLPPLTASPGLSQQGGLSQQEGLERPKSSEILEQLLNQGIIPVGQTSGAGEAYNIMLDDSEMPRRRPPVRLESLKTRKEQSPTNIEAIDQRMRLVEERRKSREDELKIRLRTKSARVRGPAPIPDAPEGVDTVTLVEQLQKPLTSDPPASQEDPVDPLLHTQVRKVTCGLAEGGERMRETGGDGSEGGGGGGGGGIVSGSGGGGGGGGELQTEVTKVEELKAGQLLTASGELENDPTFQFAENNEEIF
ncbi:stathmin domain-containing protein 1 [Diretmus argenteus]